LQQSVKETAIIWVGEGGGSGGRSDEVFMRLFSSLEHGPDDSFAWANPEGKSVY
jgi:hypothetical protein